VSGLLPSSSDTASPSSEPRIVGVDSDDADDLMDALSSATGREVLAALHDDPATPTELADRIGTSLQNVQYHLGKLDDADLVEVVDTCYSEKGREMDVYAPADRPLVLFAGDESEGGELKAELARLLGGVGVLAAASLLVQLLLARTDDGPADGPTAQDLEGPMSGADGGSEGFAAFFETTLSALPPGIVFFLGGVAVLLGVFAARQLRSR